MLILLQFILLFIFAVPILASSPCGDWDPYKDEKCVKIFHDMLTYEDAVKACHLADAEANLLSIRSTEEQEFAENLLFKVHKVVNPLWLEAKFINKVC